jgi:hypothetical protein
MQNGQRVILALLAGGLLLAGCGSQKHCMDGTKWVGEFGASTKATLEFRDGKMFLDGVSGTDYECGENKNFYFPIGAGKYEVLIEGDTIKSKWYDEKTYQVLKKVK